MKKLFIMVACFALVSLVYADIIPGFDTRELVNIGLDSFILTIVIELITSFIYIKYRKLPLKILISVAVANIISVPILWLIGAGQAGIHLFFAPAFDVMFNTVNIFSIDPGLIGFIALILIELAVIIFEYYVILYMNKKIIKKKDACVMSLINNITSFIIGSVLIALYLHSKLIRLV